jgi:GNAT superfamily N-acetyltransferase
MEVKITLLKDYPEAMPSLAKIWRETLGQWFPEVQKEKVESWLHEWLNDNIPLAYIALDKDVPVGICSLQINDGIRPDLMPWLGDLCVDKTYQNQGIGKCLVEAVQKKAKEAGFDKLYLFAPDPSIPCYYERLGWRKIGVDQYMGHTVTVMEIKL